MSRPDDCSPGRFAFEALRIAATSFAFFARTTFEARRPGLSDWRRRWQPAGHNFLTEYPKAEPEELLKQLHNMWKPIPWLER
jgi:hypothetical protein